MSDKQDKNRSTHRPRRSSRPSLLKLVGLSELSAEFGISLSSDSESDQEFTPPTGNVSSDSSSRGNSSDEDEDEEEEEEEIQNGDMSHGQTDKVEEMVTNSIDNPKQNEELKNDLMEEEPGLMVLSHEIAIYDYETKPQDEEEEVKKKNVICCVCLETSQDNDIVTCDKCGVSVHEGCYGLPEDDGVDETRSDLSSLSTIPWFCDPCKAGVENPMCELCPNEDGIFKQTINECWVHMVCCLYISGIEYIEPKILSGVSLDQISANRWGAKSCHLCEDERWCRTGVCVSCDAGLCKTYFHVTCAQRDGLLCEIEDTNGSSDDESSILDPYFAHCAFHSNKRLMKRKRKYYQEVISSRERLRNYQPLDDRLRHYLFEAQDDYQKLRSKMKKWYKPEEMRKKEKRSLHHSPSAFKLLTRKAEALGYNSKVPHVVKHHSSVVSVALNVDFINFFNERGKVIEDLENRIKLDIPINEKLIIRLQETAKEKTKKEEELRSLKETGTNLWNSSTDIVTKINQLTEETLDIEFLHHKDETPDSTLTSITKLSCCVCEGCHDNHLLVKCDTCGDYYHINCLDPPLSKVPKKTAQYGWQCEDCCCDSEEDMKPTPTQSDEPQSRFGRRLKRPRIRWEKMVFL